MKTENKLTFMNFLKICKAVDAKIGLISFELEGLKGQVKADLRLKGTFIEVSQKLEKLLKSLQPFIADKFLGKWLSFQGSIDLHEYTGLLDVEVGFRGMSIEFEGETTTK